MGFRIRAGTIRANETLGWMYRRSGGADFGAQYAMADSGGVAELEARNQAMFRAADGTVQYSVRISNLTPVATEHDLVGGGIT